MRKLLIGAACAFAVVAPAAAEDIQYNLKVDGITCPFCVATTEKALRKVDGVKLVSADLETGIIRVCTEDSVKFTDAQLTRVFLKKGFTYRGMETQASCASFENTTVLSDEELDRRAAKHDTLGHGEEDFDFLGDHDHDGDGKPDHGPDGHDDDGDGDKKG